MSEISNIGITNTFAPAYRTAGTAPAEATQPDAVILSLGEADPVEFSRMGRMLAGALENSSLRLAKIQSLRSEIADGSFETPERISGTVDRIIQMLG